jgi:hypothetical protein
MKKVMLRMLNCKLGAALLQWQSALAEIERAEAMLTAFIKKVISMTVLAPFLAWTRVMRRLQDQEEMLRQTILRMLKAQLHAGFSAWRRHYTDFERNAIKLQIQKQVMRSVMMRMLKSRMHAGLIRWKLLVAHCKWQQRVCGRLLRTMQRHMKDPVLHAIVKWKEVLVWYRAFGRERDVFALRKQQAGRTIRGCLNRIMNAQLALYFDHWTSKVQDSVELAVGVRICRRVIMRMLHAQQYQAWQVWGAVVLGEKAHAGATSVLLKAQELLSTQREQQLLQEKHHAKQLLVLRNELVAVKAERWTLDACREGLEKERDMALLGAQTAVRNATEQRQEERRSSEVEVEDLKQQLRKERSKATEEGGKARRRAEESAERSVRWFVTGQYSFDNVRNTYSTTSG